MTSVPIARLAIAAIIHRAAKEMQPVQFHSLAGMISGIERNGLSASQLFTWRRLAREGRLGSPYRFGRSNDWLKVKKAGPLQPHLESSGRNFRCNFFASSRNRVGNF